MALADDGAVVVTVVVIVVVAFKLNVLGFDEQVPAGGAPLHETVTVPLNPPKGATTDVNVRVCPAAMVPELGEPGGKENEKSVPLPDRVIACGLPAALSEIVTAPARAPLVAGLNVIEIEQVSLGARLFPQVVVSPKSPLGLMLLMVSAALPVLASVTIFAALVVPTAWSGKATLVVERLAAGPEGVPVPIRIICWGLSPVLSVILTPPPVVPVVTGVKVMLMVQKAFAASVGPQSLWAAKSPLAVMLLMFSTAFPVFVRVTF